MRDGGTGRCSRTEPGRTASDTCPATASPQGSQSAHLGLCSATLCSNCGQNASRAREMWPFKGGLGGALRRKMRGHSASPSLAAPSPASPSACPEPGPSRERPRPCRHPPLGGAAPAAEREAPPPCSRGDAGGRRGRSAERGAPRPGTSAMAPSGKVSAGGRGSGRLRHPHAPIPAPSSSSRAGRRATAGAKLSSSEGISVPALEHSAVPAAMITIALARITVELVLLC